MKKVLLSLLLLSFFTAVQAQKMAADAVPKKVTVAFDKSHPTTTKEEWTKVDNNYEVKFLLNKKEKHLMYDKTGVLVFNESKIALSTIPAAIKKYLDTNFPEQKVDGIVKMTAMNSSLSYAVEINDSNLIFDAQGNYLRTEKK